MVKKILIIQLTRMGDSVQTLPVLKLLKQQTPGSHVTLLCIREFSGIFSRTSFFDRLVAIPAVDIAPMRAGEAFHGLNDYPELIEEYDSVVNFTHNRVGGFFCGVARGVSKSGLANSGLSDGQVKSDRAKYLFASQKCRVENLFNIVDMHAAMAGLSPEPVRGCMRVDEHELRDAEALLRQNGLRKKGRLIAFQLGANMPHRVWPSERFAALANRLLRRPGVEVVLLGSGGEKELSQAVQDRLETPAIDLVGKTAMSELPGVLKQCSILVGNDTGTIHLAAAAGTATVGLFFSTAYFGETAPYGGGHAVCQAEAPCSPCHVDQVCDNPVCRDAITVEAVEAVVEKMLGYRSMPGGGPYSPGLSVYISNFTPGGPLLYAPAEPGLASDRFIRGLIYRLLWGEALGFARDERAMASGLLGRSGAVQAEIERASEINSACLNRYAQAVRLLDQAALSQGLPSGVEQFVSMSAILKTMEEALFSSEDSILKYYHMLQMAEVQDCTYPELVGAMRDAYGRLLSVVESFEAGIASLRSALGSRVESHGSRVAGPKQFTDLRPADPRPPTE